MQIKIKFSIILLSLLFSCKTYFAQNNSSSPYSRFGIGNIERQIFGTGLAMGGTGIGLKMPFEINPINPASYSAFLNQRFIFQMGIRSRRTDFSTSDKKFTSYDNGLQSMAIGFKINKFWAASIGLTSLSSIGYKINTDDSVYIDDYVSEINAAYVGTGGLSRIYFGNAFSYKGFAAGVNASYIFGTLNRSVETSIKDNDYNAFIADENNIKVHDIMFDFGMQYNYVDDNKFSYVVGLLYSNKTELKAHSTRYVKTVHIINDVVLSDTIINDTLKKGNIQMPTSFGAGVSFQSKKLLIGFDYIQQNWKNSVFLNEKQSFLTNYTSFSIGLEYTPKRFSKELFKEINYRIGGHFSNYYLTIEGEQIKDIGVSFGFGIPLKSTIVNLGFEIGQRGTTNNGLIKENYYSLNLNFNMSDVWFIKRRFE